MAIIGFKSGPQSISDGDVRFRSFSNIGDSHGSKTVFTDGMKETTILLFFQPE